MKRSIYDYDTMAEAKQILAAIKKKIDDEREEAIFFRKRKDMFSYWLSWYFGIKVEVMDEMEEDEEISIISWLNWWFGIEFEFIDYDETENDNNAGLADA